MASKPVLDTVFIDDIDTEDQQFRISTSGPERALVDSIERVGPITPPALLQQDTGYIIISGFKRIETCRRLDIKSLPARIYPPQTPMQHCIHIAVIENALQREPNLVEQARMVRLMDQIFTDPHRLCKEAGCLGLSLNPDMAQKLRTVSKMTPVLQNALKAGHIALPVALQLIARFDETEADKIATIFGKIGLSLNRQRELVDGLIGISHREHISMAELLEDPELTEMLDDAHTDKKETSRQVRQYIKARRYPEITKTQERYQAYIKTLTLGHGIQIIPPANFEGPTFALKIDFKSYQELVSRYQNLETSIHSSVFESLWDIFGHPTS